MENKRPRLTHVIDEEDYVGHVRPRLLAPETELVLANYEDKTFKPARPHCKHKWPQDRWGLVHIDATCMLCGTSFTRYIHMECP